MQARAATLAVSPRLLLVLSVTSIVFVCAMLFGPRLRSARPVQPNSRLQLLSSDAGRQATGYGLLGTCALTLLLSVRKRVTSCSGQCLAPWRAFHGSVGLAAALLFVAHTGFYFGKNLNAALAFVFVAIMGTGALGALAKRRNGNGNVRRAAWSVALHLITFWVLVVLTAFHVFAVYYF